MNEVSSIGPRRMVLDVLRQSFQVVVVWVLVEDTQNTLRGGRESFHDVRFELEDQVISLPKTIEHGEVSNCVDDRLNHWKRTKYIDGPDL